MEWYYFLIIAIIVGVFGWIIYKARFSDNVAHYVDLEFVMLGIDKKFRNLQFTFTTPQGVAVTSTVRDVPASALALIDEGIQNQLTRHTAAYPNWTAHKNLSDYEVYLIEPMGINQETEPGSPCIFVTGYQTAGTCLGTYPRTNIKNPKIVVPHQANQNWRFTDYFMRSVWHESEHVREWMNVNNDPTGLFYYYANAGDQHPHVP